MRPVYIVCTLLEMPEKTIRLQLRFGADDIEALNVVAKALGQDMTGALRMLVHEKCLELRAKYPIPTGSKKKRSRAA